MNQKAWWRSKTLWVNVVAGAALLAQSQFGFVIDGEVQAAILTVVNLALRLITNEPVGLKDETAPGPFPGIDAGGPGASQ
ncbi:MAG: hypothetical protein D4R73_00660 [Deltaproteobacteria bacterium]|nr:MAG: hypothetical protein D4R73_00660 [Deltaproteobacteria bacterium]